MKTKKEAPQLQLIFTSQTKSLKKTGSENHSLYYLEPEQDTAQLLRFPEDEVLVKIFDEYTGVKVIVGKRFKNRVQIYVPKDNPIPSEKKAKALEEIRKNTEVIPKILF